MTSRWLAASAALAALTFGPSLATASDADVSRQLQEMQQRMQQMEDKLQATNDQLDSANQRVEEQSALIEGAGLTETRGSSNGLPGFLGEITIGGWVAASYFYNTEDPNDDEFGGNGNLNQGRNFRFYPFHPDHNSFALDQVWWEIERPISEEHRAGFRFDPAFGKTAQLLGGPGNRCSGFGCNNSDDTGIYIQQGYVQYLAPVGDGLTFKFGKFNTLIGAEVAQTIYNWNITRGSVYTLLEPIDHIGILASYAIGDSGFDVALGGVNGFTADDPDPNDAKTIIGHLGWANDTVSVGINGLWGSEGRYSSFDPNFDGDESGLINALVKVNATDRLAFYINGDYAWVDAEGDPDGWGVSVAGRYGITDRTGIALRGEYAADSEGYFSFSGFDSNGTFIGGTGIETWGITGTIDHLLTDNLMIRGEVRYDNIDKDDGVNDEFFEDSSEWDEDQVVLGVEAIYNFNKFGGE